MQLKNWQGEKLRIFYNPAAANLKPNEEFGIGFNGISFLSRKMKMTMVPVWLSPKLVVACI